MKIKFANLLSLMLTLSVPALADTVSTYDWTGVYVGGFVGGASSAKITSFEPQYINGTGFWNTYNNSNNYSTNASFIGGGTVGYNWQVAETPLLLGLEGEYGYLGMSGSNPDPNAPLWTADHPGSRPDNGADSARIGGSYGYGLVGGRIGYALDRALIYVKSGAVFTSTQTKYSDSNYGLSISGKRNNNAGYAIGGGIEYALPFEWSKNISIKTEYLYLGIDKTTTASNDEFLLTYTSNISGIHTAKIGVNYKF